MEKKLEKRISVRKGREIRLDKYLMELGLGLSRSRIQKLISNQAVLIDGKPAKPHHTVHSGELLSVIYDHDEPLGVEPEDIPVDIVYEDTHLLVVNKPPGMVVHPARGNLSGTLVNALLHHTSHGLSYMGDYAKPGVVHRIDKDTSGLLVFAKEARTHSMLGQQVERREMKRTYLLLVWGVLPTDKGTIEAPIGRNTLERKKMKVTPFASRKAITHFKVLLRFTIATLIRAQLETGRTHQIRVHFSHLGYPVLGDPDYSGRKATIITKIGKDHKDAFNTILKTIKRQALHAAALSFFHPVKKKHMSFIAPLPDDFKQVLRILYEGYYTRKAKRD
jgi:23S rRNA pseudouridine1911/1915/1917 synthase